MGKRLPCTSRAETDELGNANVGAFLWYEISQKAEDTGKFHLSGKGTAYAQRTGWREACRGISAGPFFEDETLCVRRARPNEFAAVRPSSVDRMLMSRISHSFDGDTTSRCISVRHPSQERRGSRYLAHLVGTASILASLDNPRVWSRRVFFMRSMCLATSAMRAVKSGEARRARVQTGYRR